MGTINFILLSLAVLTSFACVVFLFRGYAGSGVRLLLWTGLCFVLLALNNLLIFLDRVVLQDFDFRPYRLAVALVGILLLLYGYAREAVILILAAIVDKNVAGGSGRQPPSTVN
ncbi:MAG TPA: DUF5985 family protein [Burkholderiales bacterium]|nr:DUF5985 family protein [Burkholderiales bacterium]